MWKQLYELFTNVVTLTHRMDTLEQTVTDQRRDLRDLWAIVQRQTYEQQRAAERETHEREMLALRLENQFLKSGRQLPSASDADDKQ